MVPPNTPEDGFVEQNGEIKKMARLIVPEHLPTDGVRRISEDLRERLVNALSENYAGCDVQVEMHLVNRIIGAKEYMEWVVSHRNMRISVDDIRGVLKCRVLGGDIFVVYNDDEVEVK